MSGIKEDRKFEQVVYQIDPQGKLLRAWPLTGGYSAEVTALEMERSDGRSETMVVRLHGAVDLKQNPDVAEDEFKILQITQSEGLATPAPIHIDTSCRIFPTPYLVIAFIKGDRNFAPTDTLSAMEILATQLAGIHRIDGISRDLTFLPDQVEIYTKDFRERPEKMDASIGEERIRQTLDAVWPLTQQNTDVLLHGDYWPGNMLWDQGQLAAVIDWEDAKFGDPLADVAIARLEILWDLGMEAMEAFTHHYQTVTSIDFTNLPYWDLCAALRPAFKIPDFAEDEQEEKRMYEAHRWFVDQAYHKIART